MDKFKPAVQPTSIIDSLPLVRADRLLPQIRQQLRELDLTIVVLDDDPTGTQTVYDVPVITDWASHHLEEALSNNLQLLYILTNSRSLPAAQAGELTAQIGRNLRELASRLNRRLLVISRSDSTLRGHYPLEVEVLASELGFKEYALVLAPFFKEGGRFTIDDIHYVQEGDELIPAAETPFAADRVFGYRHSNLRNWIEEKTKGRIVASSVRSLGIADIREGGTGTVKRILKTVGPENPVILNATELSDLDVASVAILELAGEGKQFVFRTAASFVQSISGLASKPLLDSETLNLSSGCGGLIVVGSYVPKTTTQIERLLKGAEIVKMKLDVRGLLDITQRINLMGLAIEAMNRSIRAGQTVVLYTSRTLIEGKDHEDNLRIGREVSSALVEVVKGVDSTPRFIIAKGGITASDIATDALGVQCATVLGQLLMGIPVWRLETESRFPQVPYVVFPGNVGDENALLEAYRKLTR